MGRALARRGYDLATTRFFALPLLAALGCADRAVVVWSIGDIIGLGVLGLFLFCMALGYAHDAYLGWRRRGAAKPPEAAQ